MKIAYLVENYGLDSETFVFDLIHGFSSHGIKGDIIVDKIVNEKKPPLGFNLVETQFVSKNSKLLAYSKAILKGQYFRNRIENFKNRNAYNVIKKALLKNTPDVAFVEFGFNAVLVREALVELNIPFIVTFHGIDASQYFGNTLYCNAIEKVFRDCYKAIAVSEHIKRRLILNGCAENKITVVYNAFNTKLSDKAISKVKVKDVQRVIFVGRLTEKKNPLALLHAFKIVLDKFPNAILDIIGAGPLKSKCDCLITSWNLKDKIILHGKMAHSEVFLKMASASIFAQHSTTSTKGDQEGFPLSILEAASLALPIVSTIHSGIPEGVIDKETGLLVPEFDYIAMGNSIIYLLEHEEEAKLMGEKGRERVKALFNTEVRVEKIIKILKNASKDE